MTSNSVIEQIEAAWPLESWAQFNVLVAVSGGADSVALLRALDTIKKERCPDSESLLVVAHFNHQLRGVESDEDAEFVKRLAFQLQLKFHEQSADTSDSTKSENALRDQRYEFLVSVARETNCRYIVTAHHRDDQVETVLFRMFRSTGVGGLGGIPAVRVVDESLTIMRPMLNVSKAEIESALATWNQPWRRDTTNAQSQYTRNFIRNEVLPKIRERFDSVDESVARLSKQAAQQQEFLRDRAIDLMGAVSMDGTGVTIDCEKLDGQSPVLLRELFAELFRRQSWPVSQLGFRELDRLAKLVSKAADEPRFQLPGLVDCEKRSGEIHLFKSSNNESV